MSVIFYQSAVVSIVVLSLGIFVLWHNRRSQKNISFFLFALSVFIWYCALALSFLVKTSLQANLIMRIGLIGATFIVITAYHFVAAFLKKESEKKYVYVSYGVGFFLIVLAFFSKLFMSEMANFHGGYYPRAGVLHPVYMLFLLILVSRMICLLYGRFMEIQGFVVERNRVKYMLLAIAVFSFAAVDFLTNLDFRIYPFGFVFVLLYSVIVTYAIVKHQLLDIEIIIKKTLVFAGLFMGAYAVFVFFAYFGSTIFEDFVKNRWVAMVPSVLIIVLMLRPLENFLRNATDKYLFQKKYDYRELLRKSTGEMLTLLKITDLVDRTVDELAGIIKLENASILIYDEAEDRLAVTAAVGFDKDKIYAFENGKKLWTYLYAEGKDHYFLKEKINEKNAKYTLELFAMIQQLRSDLLIPLTYNRRILGILSLGKKKSDEEFTQDDIDILLPLARTLSIAISNANLFSELSQAQAQAAQAEKMAVIGTLSAGINHEICNPLGIVRGQCEMFLLNYKDGFYKDRTSEELLAKAQEIMEKVIHETDRATTITKRLSAFAKPAKGTFSYDVKIEKELEEVLALISHDLRLDNIEIKKEIQANVPNVMADKKQVQEIFFNLIRNAAQAIKGKGEILLKVAADDKKVYVDVSDTGHGMDKSTLAQIFDPFFTTKEPGEGTGLGLFIVKQIVAKNDGEISVESTPGKGTTFRVVFNAV